MASERALWIQCRIEKKVSMSGEIEKIEICLQKYIHACNSVKYKNDMDFDIQINKLACILTIYT